MSEPHYADADVTLWHGKSEHVLTTLADASIDAIVTDPPYGLEFMGNEWDGADGFRRSLNAADTGRESVFGRTSRTSPEYRTGKAKIRTRVDGRTNPAEGKSTVSTPEAYVAGSVFQQWCQMWAEECLRVLKPGGHMIAFGGTRTWHRLVCAVEDAGFEIRDTIAWLYGSGFPKSHNLDGDHEGWGTALKPGFEPAIVARKPLAGTVAANVSMHGTGAMHINACRIPGVPPSVPQPRLGAKQSGGVYGFGTGEGRNGEMSTAEGRWPTNVAMDTDTAADLDRQSGPLTSGTGAVKRASAKGGIRSASIGAESCTEGTPMISYGDTGGASRFFPVFRYEAKAPTSERPSVDGVVHPTVKPLDLMRWLVRLVTPVGGLVLDPFAGSGTTAEACVIEGFRCIAIEQDAKYLPLITSRLNKPLQTTLFAMEAAA